MSSGTAAEVSPVSGGHGQGLAAVVPRVDYLRRQLANLEADLDLARASRQHRLVPQLDKRISEVRAELDAALEPEHGVLELDRTAMAVAAEIERRWTALRLRAEILRRNLER